MQVKTVQYGARRARAGEPRAPASWCAATRRCRTEELAANRCDFGDEILAHPLDDDYHRARSPQWDKITVPLLSAANWGGQGLHPRGNFEGFVRAASKEKWLEAHGIEHWTHFYTDYGVALQKRFFGHFLKGEDTGWDKQPRVQLQVRHPSTEFVERHENEWPIARTRWTKLYLDPGRTSRSRDVATATAKRRRSTRSAKGSPSCRGRWKPRPRSPGRSRRGSSSRRRPTDADLFLVLRVFTPDLREVVFMGAIDPHTPIAQGWLRASHRKLDPKLSTPYRPYHTHDEKQPLTPGEIGRARHRALADQHRGAGRLSRRAHRARPRLRVRGSDRRAALELQERAERLRAVPARRSARPADARSSAGRRRCILRETDRAICCCLWFRRSNATPAPQYPRPALAGRGWRANASRVRGDRGLRRSPSSGSTLRVSPPSHRFAGRRKNG